MSPKRLAEGCQLVVAGEIERAIGGKDAAEEPQMFGDALGKCGIGGSGEVDRAAGGVLLLKKLQKFAVVGQMSYV